MTCLFIYLSLFLAAYTHPQPKINTLLSSARVSISRWIEMEGSDADIYDWEVLLNSDSSICNLSESADNFMGLDELSEDSHGVIRSDYFSLDSHNKYATMIAPDADGSERGSVGSENPSWIEPGSETPYPGRTNSGGLWSDSGSDRSDSRKLTDMDGENGLAFVEDAGPTEKVGEIGAENRHSIKYWSDSGETLNLHDKNKLQGEINVDDSGNSGNIWSDSGGLDPLSMELQALDEDNRTGIAQIAKETEGASKDENSSGVELAGVNEHSHENKNIGFEEMTSGQKEEKRRVVWWKVPLELLKYCVFRVSPVWSFSVAAAVMGFVILGRKLYKMKRKPQGLQLRVTVDDKKVSQFMSHAARLNEAFSVVRRVPLIRPSLPAPGVVPWPIMSLR
ncbi:hypothetical protein Nepgr_001955 [Nepenthes gracilis]|uniref:DUF6821 domain-containing protein n=1 Tax=Nepenthes gracilis TaxID=150966 RepID=A0AAD3P5F4_NEPGR|nr:hypothetical protein Nepgr_001955 [Nepenthes gracilis]